MGSCTLLLVDDNAAIRRVGAGLLEELGYAVVESSSGADALARVEARPDIALVVTDVVMRGMDGLTLARHVRDRRPTLPILFVSGYGPVIEHQVQDAVLLEKPFRLAQLSKAVRAALDGLS